MCENYRIRTEGLTREVNGNFLVQDVNITLPEQRCTGVIGPSGAGKTTLLRLLNRLDEPTSGTVFLDGVDYRTLDVLSLRQQVGLVPQSPSLMEGSVRDNLSVGPRLRDESYSEERVQHLLEELGLFDLRHREAMKLSAGEAQRVAIGRTVMNDPDLLMLDEPTAHLDSDVERDVEKLLKDLQKQFELTLLLVTHSQRQARRLCSTVIRLRDGRVYQSGTVEEVLNDEQTQS